MCDKISMKFKSLFIKPLTKTLIIMIIDESGSMGPKKSDVIGGFNEFLKKQKKVMGDSARLILVKFNSVSMVIHSAIDINSVPKLNESNYRPSGLTALYDAIVDGIELADEHKEPSERVICVIMTDGEENSSRRITPYDCKGLIEDKEALDDWTFVYIGINPVEWSKTMKTPPYNVRDERSSDQKVHFKLLTKGISDFREGNDSKSITFFG